MLDEKLRQADSLAIIVPSEAYIMQEADIVERFVDKGGKLLLIADPTRPHNLNSLAERRSGSGNLNRGISGIAA